MGSRPSHPPAKPGQASWERGVRCTQEAAGLLGALALHTACSCAAPAALLWKRPACGRWAGAPCWGCCHTPARQLLPPSAIKGDAAPGLMADDSCFRRPRREWGSFPPHPRGGPGTPETAAP